MSTHSLLKQARLSRGWNRSQVIVKVNSHFSIASLERWEASVGLEHIREDNVSVLCQLYGLTPQALGLGENHAIMGVAVNMLPTEETPMSDILRREIFSNPGSRLMSLINTWPARDHHYEELQSAINSTIIEYQDPIYAETRRQALKDMAIMPILLVSAEKRKTPDASLLLRHAAAGITACWYLRRGRDLAFVNEATSEYIRQLSPLLSLRSYAYQRASARLLSQCFRLKGMLTNSDQAIAYEEEAIRYGLIAENSTEQVIANRQMAFSHWRQGCKQALSYAERAYGLMDKETPGMVRSFTASGLAFCQAINGKTDNAIHTLAEARNLFDPTIPVSSIQYTESNLLGIRAQVSRCCGNFQDSVDLWEESLATPTLSILGKIEQSIDYAKMEVCRDDQPRDLGLCIKLLTKGMIGARELDSEEYILLAHEVYNLLRVAWPREDAVKKLGKEHFSVTK